LAPTGTCALCQTADVELIDSHIVPRWLYKRVAEFHPEAGSSLVEVSDGNALLQSKQTKDFLLCGNCENLLSKSETYAAQVVLQPDDTFPLLDRAQSLYDNDSLKIVSVNEFDTAKLTHFAVSVFWRADVAQIEPIVHLGGDLKAFREYLLDRVSLPASADLIVTLIKPRPGLLRVDQVLSFPQTQDDQPCHHEFFACGIRFMLFTSNTLPVEQREFSFFRKQVASIERGTSFLKAISKATKTSRPLGKLAQEFEKEKK
jgi:hypothetical protein